MVSYWSTRLQFDYDVNVGCIIFIYIGIVDLEYSLKVLTFHSS